MNPQQVSVITPVFNGGENWVRCLDALARLQPGPGEIIVVDDGSTDGSAEHAVAHGAQVLSTGKPMSGPAVARNLGAASAHGDIIFFLDADVMPYPDAIARVARAFANPTISAIFGSYDDAPAAANFLSQYKNLMHHYVHQVSRAEARTFWAGCGAIRRPLFLQLGGFASTYARPSIEDIELGYRLRRQGYKIELIKDLQVKHLKRWTWGSLLRSDIFDRALPWTELILRERDVPADLNLQLSHRISALLCLALLFSFPALFLSPFALTLSLAMVGALIVLNFDLYRFFWRRRGVMFTLGAIPVHWLYYVYSSFAFAWVVAVVNWRNLTASRQPVRATVPKDNAPR